MKKITSILPLFAFVTLIFICNSCNKPTVNSASSVTPFDNKILFRNGDQPTINDYDFPFNEVTVVDNMLYFTSKAEVDLIIDYLDSLSNDEEKNLDILNRLGYEGFESEGAPEEPALDLFIDSCVVME
jgi:hypothetical protein